MYAPLTFGERASLFDALTRLRHDPRLTLEANQVITEARQIVGALRDIALPSDPAPEIYGVLTHSNGSGKVRVMLVDGTWHDEYVAVVRERLKAEGKTWTEGPTWTITARPTHCYGPVYANTKGEIYFGLSHRTHDAAAQDGAPRDGYLGVVRCPLDWVNGDDDA